MGNWDNIISNWISKQNDEFLQKVKCSYVFIINKDGRQNRKPFALISQDGKQLKIIDGITAEFHKSYTPNQGIYQGICTNTHEHSKQQYIKDEIKIKQDISAVYLGIAFRENQVLLSMSNCITNIDDYGIPIFLMPVVF